MAIDSKQKRGSAIGLRQAWVHVLPDADGSLSQADRQDTAFTYAGILAASPVVAQVTKIFKAIAFTPVLTAAAFKKVLTGHRFDSVLTARED